MAGIERITNVQITLGTSGADQRSFSRMCVLIPFDGLARSFVVSDPDTLLEAPFSLASTSMGYKAVQAAFSQRPGPVEIVVGRIDDEDTSPAMTLAAIANEDDSWYGFCDSEHSQSKAVGYAAWGEAHTKLFGAAVTGGTAVTTTTTDTGSLLKAGNFFATYTCHVTNLDEFPEIALMAKLFATQPGGETWGNVTLSGVPTSVLSDTEISNLEFRNINYFTNYRNLALARNGKTAAGEWIDIIRFKDWLEEEIRIRCFNVQIDTKIPYTDVGIAIYGQAIAGALDLGTRRGGIVAPYPNDKGTDIIPGYEIKLPRAAQVSNADKRSRVLRDISFRASLQGAIHASEITGRLIYDPLAGSV